MHRIVSWQVWGGTAAAAAVLAVGALGLTPAAAQSGPVSSRPAAGTPFLYPNGHVEQVRQIVQCGKTMYAVGNFSRISQSGKVYTHRDVFSFSATRPFKLTSWDPVVNGTVNSIAVSSDCLHAYIGGDFTKVDHSNAHDIAEIRTYNNTMVPNWGHFANKVVYTVLLTPKGHLLVGGRFTTINGSSAHAFYASLNPLTGGDDGYLNLHISGHYVFKGSFSNGTSVYNQQLSPNGGDVLVEGVFTSVERHPRQQIFMLNLGLHGNVNQWQVPEFSKHCADKHPFYVKAAAWSPDESVVYVADTGLAPLGWNGKFPLTGICDAVAAFPARHAGGLTKDWVNYSGCDSFFSAAADSTAVYAGGHERWADNQNGCNSRGPGGVVARGMGGFRSGASGGSLLRNSAGTAGRYSRARGLGADDMLVTHAGLWIASDNFDGSFTCGGIGAHTGICFLPY